MTGYSPGRESTFPTFRTRGTGPSIGTRPTGPFRPRSSPPPIGELNMLVYNYCIYRNLI